jgi:hypothetical protein
MTVYANIDDLTARFPRALTPAETAAVPIMLDDASFLLSVKAPGLQDAIDAGNAVVVQAAMLLTVAMVSRLLESRAMSATALPNVDQMTQAYGPYTSSIKYRDNGSSLFLYSGELEYLLGLIRGNPAASVSMRSPGL